MIKLIIFDSPPTLSECETAQGIDIILSTSPPSTWFPLPDLVLSTEVLQQYQQSNQQRLNERLRTQNDDEEEENSLREQSTELDGSLYYNNAVTDKTFLVLPPPRSNRNPTHSQSGLFPPSTLQLQPQPQQDSYAVLSQLSGASDTGDPPLFPWRPESTQKLNTLHALAQRNASSREHNQYERKPHVNLLAAIIAIESPTQVGANYIWKASLTLKDMTGASFKIILWGQEAREWTNAVKKGDIVYIGGVGVAFSSYDGALTGNITPHSVIQVTYRTRPETEADEAYSFDSRWASMGLETARLVWELVLWLGKQSIK